MNTLTNTQFMDRAREIHTGTRMINMLERIISSGMDGIDAWKQNRLDRTYDEYNTLRTQNEEIEFETPLAWTIEDWQNRLI
jgi:hypothetical protein